MSDVDAEDWDVPTWNGAPSRLVIAFEYDEDSELPPWCWRVAEGGEVLAQGRTRSRASAILEALKHCPPFVRAPRELEN